MDFKTGKKPLDSRNNLERITPKAPKTPEVPEVPVERSKGTIETTGDYSRKATVEKASMPKYFFTISGHKESHRDHFLSITHFSNNHLLNQCGTENMRRIAKGKAPIPLLVSNQNGVDMLKSAQSRLIDEMKNYIDQISGGKEKSSQQLVGFEEIIFNSKKITSKKYAARTKKLEEEYSRLKDTWDVTDKLSKGDIIKQRKANEQNAKKVLENSNMLILDEKIKACKESIIQSEKLLSYCNKWKDAYLATEVLLASDVLPTLNNATILIPHHGAPGKAYLAQQPDDQDELKMMASEMVTELSNNKLPKNFVHFKTYTCFGAEKKLSVPDIGVRAGNHPDDSKSFGRHFIEAAISREYHTAELTTFEGVGYTEGMRANDMTGAVESGNQIQKTHMRASAIQDVNMIDTIYGAPFKPDQRIIYKKTNKN
jgi:hypothetical protein